MKELIITRQSKMRGNDKGTFYIYNSSAWDRIGYDADILEDLCIEAGAEWTDQAEYLGWSNLPDVVVFHGTRHVYDKVGELIIDKYGFAPIITPIWFTYLERFITANLGHYIGIDTGTERIVNDEFKESTELWGWVKDLFNGIEPEIDGTGFIVFSSLGGLSRFIDRN